MTTPDTTDPRRWRSAQVEMFALLILAMVTSGVFVGYWLSFTRGWGSTSEQAVWMLGVIGAILAVAAAATRLTPALLRVQHRWEPVPAGDFPRELDAFAAATLTAGLRTVPQLMWNPTSTASGARAWGRRGRYRVTVSPSLLSAASRRADAFEVVIQHELAHIRLHDVTLSYATFAVWWATITALLTPVAARVVDHDLSELPAYLPRAAALMVIVHLVGTAAMRRREHAADLAAAATMGSPDAMVELLTSLGAGGRDLGRVRRAIAWHPAMSWRARVVAEPDLARRLGPAEFLGVGLVCGLPIPLLTDLFDQAGPVTAAQLARGVAFGLAGAYVAAVVQRVAPRSPRRAVALPALAFAAGVAAAQAVSLGGAQLSSLVGADVAGYTITAALLASVTVWAFDVARSGRGERPRGPLTVAVALAFVLAEDAVLAATELIRVGGGGFLVEHLTSVLTERPAVALFAVLVAAVSLPAAVRPSRWAPALPARIVLAGVVGGAGAGVATLLLRLVTSPEDGDAKLAFYDRSIWIIAVAGLIVAGVGAVRYPQAVAVPHAAIAAGCAVVTGACAFVVLNDVCFNSTMGAAEAATTARYSGALGVLLLLPITTVITLAREPGTSEAPPVTP